jgi:hypothetical protein
MENKGNPSLKPTRGARKIVAIGRRQPVINLILFINGFIFRNFTFNCFQIDQKKLVQSPIINF